MVKYRVVLLYVCLSLLCIIIGISLGLNKRSVYTIGSLALLSLLFFLFVRLVKEIGDRSLLYLILSALIIRCAIAIFFGNSSLFQQADALSYHAEAVRFSLALLGTGPLVPTAASNAFGYVYFVSFIYAGIGASSLIPILINCFVGVACGAYVYKIALEIWKDRRVALFAASLALFMPGVLIWSTFNLKDSWVNLFILIALWRLILIRERGLKINDLIIVAACIGALWTTRFYMTLIIAPLLLYAIGAGRKKSLVYLGILFLILVLVFSYAFIGRTIRNVTIGLEDVSNRLSELATEGGSSTGVFQDISSPSGAIAFLPKGLVLLLFSPFPWKAPTSTLSALSYPETILMYILWPLIIIGIIETLRRKPEGFDILILYTASAAITYALLAGNIGTFYRIRTPIVLLLFVFAAGGILKIRRKRAQPATAEVD